MDWVLGPLGELEADVFYLFEAPIRDEARIRWRKRGVNVDRAIQKVVRKPLRKVAVDLWHPPAVARAVAGALRDSGAARLSFNISCGPNPVAVGATLASVFWSVRVYHVNRGAPGVNFIPTVKLPHPPERDLRILDALCQSKGGSDAGRLKRGLRIQSPPVFDGTILSKTREQAEHGQFMTSVDRLLKLGAVRVDRRAGRIYLEATDDGRQLREMLATSPSTAFQVA